MGTDTCQGKATRFGGISGAPPPPEALPCPRCDSANTKFCYYNNYNFSQPRHFCRSCRRYWTRGGTLRDVPVGGGSRKNAKRCRTTSSGAGALSQHDGFRHFPAAAPQFQGPLGVDCGGAGSFTSLLSGGPASGFLALGGVGIGDVGFGLGREVWPFTGAVGGGPTSCSVDGEGGHTWQMVNGDAMYGGDCFGWPDLAISTPGTSTSTSSSTLLLK